MTDNENNKRSPLFTFNNTSFNMTSLEQIRGALSYIKCSSLCTANDNSQSVFTALSADGNVLVNNIKDAREVFANTNLSELHS